MHPALENCLGWVDFLALWIAPSDTHLQFSPRTYWECHLHQVCRGRVMEFWDKGLVIAFMGLCAAWSLLWHFEREHGSDNVYVTRGHSNFLRLAWVRIFKGECNVQWVHCTLWFGSIWGHISPICGIGFISAVNVLYNTSRLACNLHYLAWTRPLKSWMRLGLMVKGATLVALFIPLTCCSFIAIAEKTIDARSHIGIDRHTQCVNGRGQIGMFFAPVPCYIILVCSKCSHVIICNNIAPQRI